MSALPPGFTLDPPPARSKGGKPVRLDPYQPTDDVVDLGTTPPGKTLPMLPGSPLIPSGRIVDGDTFGLTNGRNARVLGFDAFERGQLGYRADGTRINLGDLSTGALLPYLRQSQSVTATGGQTYGRPVVTLGDGANDPTLKMLWQGAGYAAPEYLGDDPQRAASYTEAERLGRLNRQGGFGTGHVRPDAYRRPLTTRTAKLAADEYLAFDDELPDDAPKITRLLPEQEARIAGFVTSKAGDPNFSYEVYRDWFRDQPDLKGYEPANNPAFIESVRKGEGFSANVNYGNLDADAKREFEELVAFSGMRPEDAKGYRDLLKSGDQAQVLEYAQSKGMALDPRDVSAYFAARAKGGNAPIPLPLIDPGDGRTGAAARGFGDPLGFIDELGGVVDTLGGTENRENVWNSDRSFGEIYENNTRQNRGIIDHDETRHPYARAGGQLVSGLALPFGGGVRGAAGFAKAGAIEGGIYGFGSGDGSLGQRLANVPLNAAGGALGGAIIGKGIDVAAPLIKRGVSRFGLGGGPAPSSGSLASAVANDLPPGFTLDAAQPQRLRDTINIPPTAPSGSLLPALPSPVSTTYPGPRAGAPRTLAEIADDIKKWGGQQGEGAMFHGSRRNDITEFDPYGRSDHGLFGQGTYLTDDPNIAASYSGKGLPRTADQSPRSIYAVNQSVKNPLDMDAPADPALWRRVAGDYADFTPDMTNEQAYRAVEEALGAEALPKWEGAEMMADMVRNMGHDGLTHIGGGRFGRGNGPSHRVVIALDPEQTQISGRLPVGDMLAPPMRDRDWIDVQQHQAGLPEGFTLDAPQGRAGMVGNALPSLSSPRVPDVIDVNANRPTRLLDAPTDAMMRAASARVQPGDVLPRPSNEVSSLDEAAAIGKGLYPQVKAPRERDYLETRRFPSLANPENMIPRKGPIDLVGFVRSRGGVADWRGELRHAGIDNDPRNLDFTQAEQRLGKLVDDEAGSTLDDMALRAWEAGYFPDHYQRPTVDEFVQALSETQSGAKRLFHPDDFDEIDAFEGARQTRWDVEKAQQDGAPLVADMGQPATLDDMIANTPPATAYDDWNNAVVSKVGNVRVSKLNSPQDIGQALKIAENVAGGFDAAKRGKISFAETQALAQDLGMTADDLLARRKGQAFNAEEAYAARAVLAKSGSELVTLAKRIQRAGEDPGSELLAVFQKALVRHTAIQEQVSGATAEAGRALSAFRMMADSKDAPGRILESIVNGGGGKGRIMDAASAIIDLERDPANLNQFIEKVSKPTWKDKAIELWYNYLLSGPQTHVVNMLSNTMTSVAQIPEFAVAAGVGAARRAMRREAADRVLWSEVGARSVGLIQGTKEGVRMFANAMKTGEASDFVTKIENQGQKAISGLKGEALRLPSRFLTAEDELFKGIARRMELNGLAIRKASKEGLKGQEAKDRAAELLTNPTDDMMQSALEYGRYVTFQAPLGRFASKVSQATTEMPILKAVLPFVRTPTNLFKFFVERSPAAPLMREFRKDFAAGGAKRDLAVAKVMIGSGMGAVVAEMAEKGLITGSPPTDDNKRGLMQADGWQPYSIKIGDKYYSYKRLDPFALTIGAAADLATLSDGMTDKQLDNQAGIVTASIIGNLSNKTWLSGVSDLLAAADDPERYGSAFLKRLAGSVAIPTGVAQIARTMDPTARETPDIASAVQARIPGLSDNLLPKRDVWGQPIVNEGGVGPDLISPIWTTTDRKDPITREVLRVDATISKPQKTGLTPEQYDRLQAAVGPAARKWLGDLFASPEYRSMSREDQAAEVGKVMTAARKAGKSNVLTGDPMPSALPIGGRRKAAAPPGLPPGFQLDALPPGFQLDD